MKILLFTEIYDCGGVDTFLINLINAWPVEGDSFVLVANKDYPGLAMVERGVARRVTVIRHEIRTYRNFWNSSKLSRTLKRLFSPFLRYAYIAAGVLLFRPVLGQAGADVLIVVNGGYPGGETCRAASISWGIFATEKPKSIHNYHGVVQEAPWYLYFQECAVDLLMRTQVSQFVGVSRAAAGSMAARPLIFRKEGRVCYIHNGLSPAPRPVEPRIAIREQIGITEETPLCLMLSTYDAGKGHLFLLTAFKRVLEELNDAHLLICGYGRPEDIQNVAQYVADMGLNGYVHLMEFRNDVSHLLGSCDVLVIASQASESFGFTSIEAMAHKVPVVATDVGGLPEVVINGEGGYCVESKNVESYAQHIVMLLRDPTIRQEQGERGYTRYQNHFSSDVMAFKYAKVVNSVALALDANSSNIGPRS